MMVKKSALLIAFLLLASLAMPAMAEVDEPLDAFDDRPLDEPLTLPDWFKVSFLDIKEDLEEANHHGRGLIIYFGMKHCPYCKAHLENNWGRPDIINYTRQHFDVIGIDVRGSKPVTELAGTELNEKEYAKQQKANFTPSLIFYDKHGQRAFKLSGYRQAYQFKAVLEYVADDHHQRESFPQYFARAETAESFGQDALNESPLFETLMADKKQINRPSVVFFERPRCHACDVLHGTPLKNSALTKRLEKFNTMQVDISMNNTVITPQGKSTTASQWAKALRIDYTPTLIFFDTTGKEILRIDSVVWFYRLRNILDYVLSEDYKQYPNFQDWRFRKNR